VSLIVLPILLSVSAIIWLALGIYGFRVLKADWSLAEKTEKISVQRPTLIGVCVGCIFAVGGTIVAAIASSGIISDETLNIVDIVSLPLIKCLIVILRLGPIFLVFRERCFNILLCPPISIVDWFKC